MQVFVGEACVTPTPQLVFPSQPLTDPLPGMVIDPSIGFIDWALAKVFDHPTITRLRRPTCSSASSQHQFALVNSLIRRQIAMIFFFDGRWPMKRKPVFVE